jgi:ribosomal 30S subunit maturation factor RimM
LAGGRFYVKDVLGSLVFSGGNEFLGEVKSIDNFGSADVYTVIKDGCEIMFPLIKKMIINFDVRNKKLVLDAEIFKEVTLDDEEKILKLKKHKR